MRGEGTFSEFGMATEPVKKRRRVLASVAINDDLPMCPYGPSCYRKNPKHRREYRHPATPKKPSTADGAKLKSQRTESADQASRTASSSARDPGAAGASSSKDLPVCPYGALCYRRNLFHFAEFWHPLSNRTDPGAQKVTDTENAGDADSGDDTESCEDSSTDSDNEMNRPKKPVQAVSRGPSIVKKYSELTEEERKELIIYAMEAKKKMKEELLQTKKIIQEKEAELARMQEKLGKGMPLIDGEKEALAGNDVKYFPLFAEREYKEGSANQIHFRLAESQFYRLLAPGANVRIEKVDYVVAPELVKRFKKAREKLKKNRGEDMSYPVLAFHGTVDDNIDSIVREGFRVPGDEGFKHATDTGFYGSGVYFSEYPNYAMGYIKGGNRLLLCLVLLGKAYRCDKLIRGAARMTGHDSHTSPDVKELIIFHSHHILPCYVVYYRSQYGDFKYKTVS